MSIITVKAATNSNIDVFPPSGEQRIDGITISKDGDLVLVKNQNVASQNGIWQKKPGVWARAAMALSGPQLLSVAVIVEGGTMQAGTLWQCAIGSIAVGTTPLSFRELPYYRPTAISVRVATDGPMMSPPEGLFTLDGVALVTGDLVLVKDQTDPAQNGIYVAVAGAWPRHRSANSDAELTGMNVVVREGKKHFATSWRLGKAAPFTIDRDSLPFYEVPPALQTPRDLMIASTINVVELR